MGFFLLTELPGDENRLQGVERFYRQDRLPHTPPDGDCVAIPTVIMYAKGKRGHVTNRSLKSLKNKERYWYITRPYPLYNRRHVLLVKGASEQSPLSYFPIFGHPQRYKIVVGR